MGRQKPTARAVVVLVLVALLLAATVAACGGSSKRAQSGLQGRVRFYVRFSAEPAGPSGAFGAQLGLRYPPSSSRVWSPSSFRVFDDAGTVVATVTTQRGGRFKVALRPGTYYLDVGFSPLFVPSRSSSGQVALQRPVAVVRPEQFTDLNLEFSEDAPVGTSHYFLQ
jgi:hypothetical protein